MNAVASRAVNFPAVTILCDTREPDWPAHPWRPFIPAQVAIERAALETGDFALKGNEGGAVVERKAVPDLLGCIGSERERFERELARGRFAGRFIVVCEGSLESLLSTANGRGFSLNAIMGTLAAWQRRFCPVFFAGTPALAAHFALRFLAQPLAEAQKLVASVTRPTRQHGQPARRGACDPVAKVKTADLAPEGSEAPFRVTATP